MTTLSSDKGKDKPFAGDLSSGGLLAVMICPTTMGRGSKHRKW